MIPISDLAHVGENISVLLRHTFGLALFIYSSEIYTMHSKARIVFWSSPLSNRLGMAYECMLSVECEFKSIDTCVGEMCE